jgi:transketolase
VDGHDVEAVSAAIQAKLADKPTLICCRTVIGKGSPNLAGTDKVHGAALGDKEIAAVREALGWPSPLRDPGRRLRRLDAKATGADFEAAGSRPSTPTPPSSRPKPPNCCAAKGELPAAFESTVTAYINSTLEKKETIATRKASQNAIQAWRRRCRNSWAARPT